MHRFWFQENEGRGYQYRKSLPSYHFGYTIDREIYAMGVIFPDSDKMYHVIWSGNTAIFPTFEKAKEYAKALVALEN
jgi:hypothetical protein